EKLFRQIERSRGGIKSGMDPHHTLETVRHALREDIGRGDHTTEWLVDDTRQAAGYFLAKEAGVLAGLSVAEAVFRYLDPDARFQSDAHDGERLETGRRFAHVQGRARALLSGERVALNFLQRMSGIATLTRRAVDSVQGTPAKILDTRKTVPLLRAFDK